MQNVAIESLVQKRQLLIIERTEMMNKFNKEISDIATAIETLSGKKVWEVMPEFAYDDENPTYIKSSEEEI